MEPLTKIIELNTNSLFNDLPCDDVIHGLLANGYVLNITPCKYNDDEYTVMIEIGDIDDSFIPEPKVDNGLQYIFTNQYRIMIFCGENQVFYTNVVLSNDEITFEYGAKNDRK